MEVSWHIVRTVHEILWGYYVALRKYYQTGDLDAKFFNSSKITAARQLIYWPLAVRNQISFIIQHSDGPLSNDATSAKLSYKASRNYSDDLKVCCAGVERF